MNDKLIWFGRYLGCKAIASENIFNNCTTNTATLTPEVLYFIKHFTRTNDVDIKLILKGIDDISEEDAMEYLNICHDLVPEGIIMTHDKHIITIEMYSEQSEYPDDVLYLYFDSDEITCKETDFLRSKGYAIGIPKEFYITEKELEDK